MKCKKCGMDMAESAVCPECGWRPEDDFDIPEDSAEFETEVDIDSLENLQFNFNEVDGGSEYEQEDYEKDDFDTSNDELVIDFDEINQNVVTSHKHKGSSSWLVAFVSFIAGVLATLITIGCFNGTIISYFDRITNGTPTETVENFCKFYYQSDSDVEKITNAFSPYLRAQIVSELQSYVEYYGVEADINLDIDVTNDSEFAKVAEYYLSLVTQSLSQKITITSLDYKNIEYYKSGTDEFNSYLSEYQSSSDEKVAAAEGVSLFAKVSFSISYDIKTIQQETTTVVTTTTETETKKNNKKAEQTTQPMAEITTTQATTEAPTEASVETATEECIVVCVKINDSWYVFNGMQTES